MNISESIPDPPLAANERIDEICIRYEDSWMQGERPQLESYLDEVEAENQSALVYELLRIDLACGPRRELLTEEAYLSRLPDFRPVIEAVFRKRPPARTVVPFHAGQVIGNYRVDDGETQPHSRAFR